MQHTLKPYLINAYYSWCMDLGYTPLIEVQKWSENTVPENLADDDKIIFNIHPTSVRNLIMTKENIQFEAMFNGAIKSVVIEYKSIVNIYNREEYDGLEFAVEIDKNTVKNNIRKTKTNLYLIKNEE